MSNIILIGFMGSGKTSCGKELSRILNVGFFDTDEMIEQQQNMTIADIFEKHGEAYFRKLETELVESLIGTQIGVLSVGGGLAVTKGNDILLKKLGMVVYLKAGKECLIKRLKGDSKRPLLAGGNLEEKITSLMNAREDKYISAADIVFETENMSVKEVAEKLSKICR